LHIKRKSAWSNASLIGCRISCLVDSKEWHEGHVVDFHKTGKHFVEFRLVNEKRWLSMKRIAFYIIERPPNDRNDFGEYKENLDHDGLTPVEASFIRIIYYSKNYD
jgi:hypothetical protein